MFKNPYVFVPFGRPIKEFVNVHQEDRRDQDLLTGVISCELTTKKNVIVPEVARGEDGKLRFYQLPYGQDGKMLPAIPGSSLRGVIRGVYESMTHSCMRSNKAHDERISAAGGCREAGLLYRDAKCNFVLCKAWRNKIWDEARLATGSSTGDVVRFRWNRAQDLGGNVHDKTRVVTSISTSFTFGDKGCPSIEDVAQGKVRGYGVFLKVDALEIDKRHHHTHPSVFVGNGTVQDNNVDESYVDALQDNVTRYKKSQPSHADAYLTCLKSMREGTCVLPVWYACQEIGGKKHYQFSHAQIGRSVFTKTINDYYYQHDVAPCSSLGALCPACSLFGYVSQQKNDDAAHASRVRFGDATLCTKDAQEWSGFGSCWLPELLEPHTSSLEFYFRNPNTPHVFTPDMPNTELAGRKFYWHHAADEQTEKGEVRSEENQELLNCEAEYVPKNKHFEFKVYVDGVTKRQLNELIYVLTLGEYWDPGKGEHGHKIGRGKPYGYGSVRIKVNDVFVRTLSADSYAVESVQKDDPISPILSQEEVERGLINVKAIRNVTLLKAGGHNVQYPRDDEDKEIYEWFFNNRELFAKTSGLPGFKSVLAPVPSRGELSVDGMAQINALQLSTSPQNNTNTLESEARRMGNSAGQPRNANCSQVAQQQLSGTIDWAKKSPASGHWNGVITYNGREKIFFHTSMSPELDLSTLALKKGMNVKFTIGKNKKKNEPIACNLRF